MLVKELIAILTEMPADLPIYANDGENVVEIEIEHHYLYRDGEMVSPDDSSYFVILGNGNRGE